MHQHFEKHKKLYAILFGALFGALVFFCVNTAQSLNVTDDSYILNGYVERDIIQHYTGWQFYKDAKISFPLGVAENIGYPHGGAVAFSDSVPVMSIFFGFFSNLLPETFQFFGIYTFLCYMLMGVSSALLLSLFIEKLLPLCCGTALFCVSPVMIERAFRHVALASQFLILFALALYFKNRKEGFKFRVGYILLSAFAVLIHFYFVPMVLAILFADLLQEAIRLRRDKRALRAERDKMSVSDEKGTGSVGGRFLKLAGFLAANVATVLLVATGIGYFFQPASPSGALGYGYFTMNLNALFNPQSVSGIVWSRFLPTFGQGFGSAEGFNYLGVGVLLVLFGAFIYYIVSFKKGEWEALIKENLALFIVCIILALFAVSTTVIANNSAFIRIDLPLWLLKLFSTFRSSGRMFWPVYYLLMLFAVVFLNKKLNALPQVKHSGGIKQNGASRKWGTVGLAALVVLQIIDISPALITKRQAFTDPQPMDNPTENTFFVENAGAFDEIFTISDDGVYQGLYIANYAVKNGMVTNEPFMARNNIDAYRADGDAEYEKLMRGEVDSAKLYIFGDINRFFDAAAYLGEAVYSGILEEEYYVIVPKNGQAIIPTDSGFIPLDEIPLTLPDYDDLTWTDGILNDNKSVVTFYDNAHTKRFLDDAEYLVFSGGKIKILNKDYGDAGWVMLTLDIDDATVLVGEELGVE